MKKLLLFLFLLVSTISKAQIGGGFDYAMNFGGAGSSIQSIELDNQGNTYFVAGILGKAVFAGQQIDGGVLSGYPTTKFVFGKIAADGTQSILNNLLSNYAGYLKSAISKTGEMYGVFVGSTYFAQDFGNGITNNTFGLKMVKFSNTGVAQWIKPIETGSNVEYGNTGISSPTVSGMQITPDGNIYIAVSANNLAVAAPNATFNTPHRIIKYNSSGVEVWRNELFSNRLASLTVPIKFVTDDGRVSFDLNSNNTQWYFNGEDISSQMTKYFTQSSMVISLNPDGSKNFTIADEIVPSITTLTGVNTTTGDLLVSYGRNGNSRSTKSPYSSLPNAYAGTHLEATNYLFSGTLIFNSSGNYQGYKLVKDFSVKKMISSSTGVIGYEDGFANGPIAKGDYVFNDLVNYGVISYYDANYNFLKAIKIPRWSSNALSMSTYGDKLVIGGDFKGTFAFGTTTLTQSFNDTDFQTRFPAYASIKNDIFIAKADFTNINPPAPSNWLGVDNNWNNATNWSNGNVPDANTIVRFNATTAQVPTVATAPTALKVIIDAGITASIPADLVLKNNLVVNGTLLVNNTGALYFTGYGASLIEGVGAISFQGTSTPSVMLAATLGNNLSLITNEPVTVGTGTFKTITLSGTSATVTGTIEITSPDVNAIAGYSATNYIVGKVTRAVNATGVYVFPITGNTFYKQHPATLTLNNLIGPKKITVETNSGGTPSVSFPSGLCDRNLGDLGWTITSDVIPTGGTYDVSFSKSVFNNGVIDANRYVVLTNFMFEGIKTPSTQTGGVTSGQTISNATVTAGISGLTQFAKFIIGINSTPVPDGTTVTTSTWTGASNTTWNLAANWNNGIVPNNSTVNAIIPSGLTNYPTVYPSAPVSKSLTINQGVTTLRLPITFNFSGKLINNGSIELYEPNFGGVTFYGSGISGNGTLRFEANNQISRTSGDLGTNNIEVNVGNTNGFNLSGKIGGNINIKSGIITSFLDNQQFLELTNPNSTIQIAARDNAIAAQRIIKAVNASGTYNFPIISYPSPFGKKYGEIEITNNAIAASTTYAVNLKGDAYKTVDILNGSDVINSFINSGHWEIRPTTFSTTGTIDLILKTSGYTNGRTNASDYVLLRADVYYSGNDAIGPWKVVPNATIVENAGLITVTKTGMAPFSSAANFSIGLKAATTTWRGTTSADWNVTTNWSNGVPSSTVKAIIENASQYPNNAPTSGSAAAAIEIAAGSTLTLPSSFYTPTGIINNGVINITGSGTFFGFGSVSTFSNLSGTGKIVFGNNSPSIFDTYYMNQTVNNGIEINKTGGVTITSTTNFGGNVNLLNGIVTMGANQAFKMTNPNATITSTASSYINGQLDRTVNASGNYNFPVGLATVYAPTSLNLNNLIGTTLISASFSNAAISGQPNNLTIGTNTVNSVLGGASWFITPNAQPTAGTYTATLTAPIGASTSSIFYVLKRADNYSFYPWTNLGTNIAANITAGVVSVSASGLTSFSQFGIGEGISTLPVKLLNFTAKADAETAKLNWQTASELNNEKFVIERADDAGKFYAIGEVKGAGNANQLLSYVFKDYLPINGNNYYRLKQIDFDGKFEFSEVKSVKFDLRNIEIVLYPNPANEVINISGIDAKNYEASLYNTTGELMFKEQSTSSTIKIPSKITTGTYILQLKLNDGSKIVKKIFIEK